MLNTREGRDLFELKDNVGIRTNGHKLAVDIFTLEMIRLVPAVREGGFWKRLPAGGAGAKTPHNCRVEQMTSDLSYSLFVGVWGRRGLEIFGHEKPRKRAEKTPVL